MLVYREVEQTPKSIDKGRAARHARTSNNLSVEQWIDQLRDHVDIELTSNHIEMIETGHADLMTQPDAALYAAEQSGIIQRF